MHFFVFIQKVLFVENHRVKFAVPLLAANF